MRRSAHDRSRLNITGLCFALVVLVVAALVSATPAGGAPALSVKWDKRDSRVSDAKKLFDGDQKGLYEPTIAIDPRNPRTMIAFAIDLSVQNVNPEMWSVTRAFRSTNGGRTWSDKGPVRYTAKGDDVTQSGDPVALFDNKGNAYYVTLASPEGRKDGIYVHRSRNGGATWDVPTVAVAAIEEAEDDVCTGTDKEWMSADPRSGKLYLTYTLFTFTCSRTGAPTDTFTRLTDLGIYLTTSDDHGKTWAEPREIWDGYALGAIPKVGPDGTLYTTFWATVTSPPTHCPTPIGVLAAKGGGRPFISLVAGSSKDAGKTWDFHGIPLCDFIAAEILKPGRFVGGSFLPSLSVDPATGIAYIAYPSFEPTQGRFIVNVITSDDGGENWSDPISIERPGADARMPVVFAEDGVARLVYVETTGIKDQDDETADGTAETLYTESSDGGRTWSDPIALSTEVGQPKEFTELGDYISIDSAGGRIAAIWTDSRNGEEAGEIWMRSGKVVRGGPTKAIEREVASARSNSSVDAVAGLPLLGPRHRDLLGQARETRPRGCVDPRQDRQIARALEERKPAAIELSCSIDATYDYITGAAVQGGYRVVFTDNEGFEAEVLIARKDKVSLFKMTRSEQSLGETSLLLHHHNL